jgi:RNA polymerase sigma factor (sigma-70 family)
VRGVEPGVSYRTRRAASLLVDDIDAGFEQIVRDHAAGVTTFIRRIVGDAAAPDVSQDTFVRALRALRAMDTDSRVALNVRPWLFTIARRTAYNALRSAGRRPSSAPDERLDHVAPGARPDEVAEARDEADRLRFLLDALPDLQRDAVVLRHVLDLSTRDAALVLGIAENTLKSHVARGLKSLRDMLEVAARQTPETP